MKQFVKLSCWNVEGWCGDNLEVKKLIAYRVAADVMFCSETWAANPSDVALDGYHCFSKPRAYKHKKAGSCRGGLAFMVRTEVLQQYRVQNIDMGMEEIMCLRLVDKHSERAVSISGVYIPPETSSFGQHTDLIYECLVSHLYNNCEDICVVMGDVNGRIGDKEDTIPDVDDVPTRINIDERLNDHGRAFLGFLLQVKMCVLNGRICPIDDNFTSISHRGKAVVDYIAAQHEHLELFSHFAVHTMSDIMVASDLANYGVTRASDHSVLSVQVETVDIASTLAETNANFQPRTDISDENHNAPVPGSASADTGIGAYERSELGRKYNKPPKKYRKGKLPNEFMQSEFAVARFTELIDELLQIRGEQEEVDSFYENFADMYHHELSCFLKEVKPTKKSKKAVRHTKKPYWTETLSELWSDFHKAEKLFVKARRNDQRYENLQNQFFVKQKIFDKELRKAKRSFQRKQMYDLEEINTNDPTAFWKHINNLGPKKKSNIPWEIINEHGDIITDHDIVLGKWKHDFEHLLKPPDDATPEQVAFKENIRRSNAERENSWGEENFNTSINRDFTTEEIRDTVMRAKSGKAPGLDGLMSDTFKNDASIELLTVLFNVCLRKHIIPTVWSLGLISPIPKSSTADKRVPLNYRGISLLAVSGKLFTSAISQRLSDYYEKNNILCNEQNGFRPKCSYLDHIFTLYNLCSVRKNLKQQTFLTFIDYQKAFDYVIHPYLYHKLMNLGVTGDIYHSIKTVYNSPQSCVTLNNELSDWFHVSSGVRQGDSLSPVLFASFINDLAKEINDVGVGAYIGGEQISLLMYADDIVLISTNEQGAQAQLDVMTNWCSRWSMKINAKKSQIIHVRNPQKPLSKVKLYCCEQELKYVSNYKYLGYIFNEHLAHRETVKTLTLAANRAFGRVVTIFKKLGNLGYRTYLTLFNTYILPILNYASGVWGYAEQAEPQILQNRICRFYLGVNKFTPNPVTKIEMDIVDIKFSRWVEMARYKNRLCNMEEHRFPVKIYKWEKSLKINGWVKNVNEMMTLCNMEECTDLEEFCDLDVLEARLRRMNRDRWWLEATTMPKLRTFINIHDISQDRILVLKNLKRNHRSLIAKLKAGVLPLHLELGRYKNSPIETRVCHICDAGFLEDELHFLYKCPGLADV